MKARKTILRISFGLRLILFLLFPTVYDGANNQVTTALVFALILFLTVAVDFLANGTVWLSAKPATLAMYAVYMLGFWFMVPLEVGPKSQFVTVSLILLLALSSDAISNSRRWTILLWLIVVYWVANISLLRPLINPTPKGLEWLLLPPVLATYAMIPLLASLTRLFFPRTKDLLHTSLDYRPVRLEVLSYGMKRPAAVGIKLA